MLLALDVGNTQTVVGMYDGETLREHWRTTTVRTHTGDELALMLAGLLELRNLALASIDASVWFRSSSSPASISASSSPVCVRTVVVRQCSRSVSPSYIPTTVWVLPTSSASSITHR